MKLFFIAAIILTVAAVQSEQTSEEAPNIEPCQRRVPPSQYDDFVKRHVLSETFDRKDREKWGSYLNTQGLCDRDKFQSFIDADLRQIRLICSRAGRRVQGATGLDGNRCISQSSMNVYDVRSKKVEEKCLVTVIDPRKNPVVVACDKVDNYCRPVHYDRYTGQQRSDRTCV